MTTRCDHDDLITPRENESVRERDLQKPADRECGDCNTDELYVTCKPLFVRYAYCSLTGTV